ncbi:filamentous hemagglutinin N-terminal domain-containing protein [Cronobacter dublinensis]|nr:filamentous hemagglutinin N-terminal domain-containing protein [Cronobacter dublinensis]
MKQRNKRKALRNSVKLQAKLAPACFATMLALGMIMPVDAAVIADKGAANQPTVHTGANGATIVDINKASAEGVSHNIYSSFDVDKSGVILNNSGSATNTQLSGQIAGNTNMAGGSAKVILNEVRSADPSQLNGIVEVAGQSAQVIIANPSGITCDGCGFINSNRATLTTGSATFDGQGNLSGLDVKKGQVIITGKGMDAASAQYADIIARSVKVNAQLKANDLSITTGTNHIAKNGRVTAITGEGEKPALALDVSSLGAMYANKIYMKGTEAGVGVRIDHADLTANDMLSLDVNGKVENNGGTLSGNNGAVVVGTSVANNNGHISAVNGQADVTARNGAVDNSGIIDGLYANADGSTVNNRNGVIHGKNSTGVTADILDNTHGSLLSDGTLNISRRTQTSSYASTAPGLINTQGTISAKGNTNIDAANVDNRNGNITTEASLNIKTNTLNNAQGHIAAGKAGVASWNTFQTNTLNNNDGDITVSGEGSELQLSTLKGDGTVSNANGVIRSAGDISFTQHLNNASGTVEGKSISLYNSDYRSDAHSQLNAQQDITITGGEFRNAGHIHAGNNMTLDLNATGRNARAQNAANTGDIQVTGDLDVMMSNGIFTNTGAIHASSMKWQLNDLENSGIINAARALDLSTSYLENHAGSRIDAVDSASLYVTTLTNDAGAVIHAGRNLSLDVKNFSNSGDLAARGDLNLRLSSSSSRSTSSAYNDGNITAGGALNAQMNRVNFTNYGTMKGDNSVYINASSLTNRGLIQSAGNVYLSGSNGVTNYETVVGDTISTSGKLKNYGTMTETHGQSADTGSSDNTPAPADDTNNDNNGNADNGSSTNNGGSTANNGGYPDGVDSDGQGAWMNGVHYRVGDKIKGKTIVSIDVTPYGYGFVTA